MAKITIKETVWNDIKSGKSGNGIANEILGILQEKIKQGVDVFIVDDFDGHIVSHVR